MRLVTFGAALVTLMAVPLRGQTIHDELILMRDRVALEATITVPADSQPSGGFPGVLLIHGYGRDKSDLVPLASLLSANGYASLAYSVRGQGNSGGYSTTNGETERLDLNEVLQHFRLYAGVNPDRIGVAGGSQGGIHAWMAAVFQMGGVAAVVPTLATPHFAADLVPNNCIKQALVSEMSLASVRYAPERDTVRDLILRDRYDSILTYINARDLERLIDSVRIPVLQGLGWKDALFPVNAGIRAAANLSSRGIPVWSYYGTNGHSEAFDLDELGFLLGRSLDWLGHWLKGTPVDRTDVPLVFYADDRPGWPRHMTEQWPPEPASVLRLFPQRTTLVPGHPTESDSLVFSVRHDSMYTATMGWDDRYAGPEFRTAFNSRPVRLLSPPLVDTADVTGVPRVHLVTSSDAGRYQAHVRVFDVLRADSGLVWQLMTRGTNGIRNQSPNVVVETDFECYALSHRIPPGHMIGLEVTSLDADESGDAHIIPYFLSTQSRLFMLPSNPSYIDIPLTGTASLADAHAQSATPPLGLLLRQNYPNPFNPATSINYQISGGTDVKLAVYDLLGREVTVLVDERQTAGSYAVRFDGSGLASGVYLYRIRAGELVQARRMILLK